MEITTLQQSTLYLGINLAYAIVALLVGVIAIRAIDRWIYTGIDFEAEIKKGNVAAAIYKSALLLFVALVIGIVLS
jgi:ABC-type tungstate transport system substrate-binding protein